MFQLEKRIVLTQLAMAWAEKAEDAYHDQNILEFTHKNTFFFC